MTKVDLLAEGVVLNGRYQIESLLGKGGAGAVYKAIDLTNNQVIAIKLLLANDSYGKDSAIRQQQYFNREVGLLQRVSHPNIIRVIDSGLTEESQPYLITEYVQGQTLKDLMKDGQLTLSRAARLLMQIGGALQMIHEQGIIHRDFKPHNVLVSGEGEEETTKLLDFGIAKMIRGNNDDAYLKTLTAAGIIAGTLHYMSPEQCQSRKLDERTDIYSMGITAYEMVSGKVPFDSANPINLIMLHLEKNPPPLQGIPKTIEGVIFKAIAKTPEQRYARVIDFVQEFSNAVAGNSDISNNRIISVDGTSAEAETVSLNKPQNTVTMTFNSPSEGETIRTEQQSNTQRNKAVKTGFWNFIREKLGF